MSFKDFPLRRLKKLSYITLWLFLGTVLIFLLFPLLPIKDNYSLKMVTSGSMSPTIRTGAIVMVKPLASYKVGDIITFQVGPSSKDIVTHRIVRQQETQFITRGDANNVDDMHPIEHQQILGKVLLTIPWLGYAANFAHSKLGFILLIVIPALTIIAEEIRKIVVERKKTLQTKHEKTD